MAESGIEMKHIVSGQDITFVSFVPSVNFVFTTESAGFHLKLDYLCLKKYQNVLSTSNQT